jgi:hypothetical protein
MNSSPSMYTQPAVSKRVPDTVLRNLSHPANPRVSAVFDDLQVTTLASLFLKFRPAFDSDPAQLSRVLHVFIGEKLACSKFSYRDTKHQMLSQDTPEITVSDVQWLLSHFATLEERVLQSWAECLEGPVSLSLYSCNKPRLIAPAINSCIFCKTSLQPAIKTQKCGGKAPGGHSWVYTYSGGAEVGNSTCKQCETIYSMQTYTPGPTLMQKIGARSAFGDNSCIACEVQSPRGNTIKHLQACSMIVQKIFCCQRIFRTLNGSKYQQSR